MNNESLIIGGEFDIDLCQLSEQHESPSSLQSVFKYSSGRSALYHILLDIQQRFGIHRLLLPDYLCSSIITTAQKAGMEVGFFELDAYLEIDQKLFSNLYQKNSAVLLINYFGLQDLHSQIEYIKSIDGTAVIIEDDVQNYFGFVDDINQASYKFTSLRKTFAIPDGGLVKSGFQMNDSTQRNRFHRYKLAGSTLKSTRKFDFYPDETYLELFEQGESMIDNELETGISEVAENIFNRTDFSFMANARKRNAEVILSGLRSLNIPTLISIKEDSVPLFIPVWLENRNRARKFLFQHNVFCPIHWPLDGFELKKSTEMAEHELSIVIDQRYSVDHMAQLLTLMEEAIR